MGRSGKPGERRRRRWAVGAVVAVLAVVAGALRYQVLPEYRPGLRDGERYGIDVSHHQGAIDWQRVADDGIDFAYIKASEGGDFTDRRFAENWEAAAAAGLDRGAYHFFTLCTPGHAQARHFLSVVPQGSHELPLAVDLELVGNCSARPPNRDVQRELATFLDIVEASTGEDTVLYVGDEFERRYPVRAELDRPLWRLRFLRRPDGDGWLVWQVMGIAHVDGIRGDVDLDVLRPSA